MASRNVDTVTRAHKFFNSRKLKEWVNEFADKGAYHDIPRGRDWSKAEHMDFLQGWIQAFSDCQVADVNYTDGGDVVIAEFTARGTNDGQLANFPATNQRLELPYCEIFRFDKSGKIQEVTAYYDLLSLLSQLGHLQAPLDQLGASPTH